MDFSREYRYCLETGTDPSPARDLRTLSIEGRAYEFTATELSALTVGDETIERSPDVALPGIENTVDRVDPVNTSAARFGMDSAIDSKN